MILRPPVHHGPPRACAVAVAALAAALLAGCGSMPKPLSGPRVDRTTLEYKPPPEPMPVYSDMDHTLACVGDQLRQQDIQPLLIGYSTVADTSGKTGVDFAALTRSAFSKVVVRSPNLAITAMGYGPTPRPEVPSVEERMLLRDPARAAAMVPADWLFTGGSTSVSSAFLSLQNSAYLSGRDVDLGLAGTRTVDLVSMSFGLKYAQSGIDLPMRTVDVRVQYQLLSSAKEAGVFATGSIDGKRMGAGLRLGRTVAVAQVPEDAIRTGIEWAVASVLADRFNIDLGACPQRKLVPDSQLPKAERLITANALPGLWRGMAPAERLQWLHARLQARGYDTGPATTGAVPTQRQRAALARAAQDAGLPPNGEPSEALFYVLAQRDLAYGRDPRKPPVAEPLARQRIHVALNQPNAPYQAGVFLRASVVAPQAGYMHCWLLGPGGAVSLLPLLPSRNNFVTAASPVLLPDNNPSGPHPRLRLTTPGPHQLWCGLARERVADRLPAELRAGGDGRNTTADTLREAFAKAAGTQLMAEGSASFQVVGPQ